MVARPASRSATSWPSRGATSRSWKRRPSRRRPGGRAGTRSSFTPARHDALPGLPFPGDPDRYPGRDEVADYLTGYARHFDLPVALDSPVRAIRKSDAGYLVDLDDRTYEADQVVVATGFRPDHGIAAELRLGLEPALESPTALGPLIDPNVHTCGTVPAHGMAELAHPEPGYVIVGMKSYGRAPTFLLATGYQQVRSVVAALAGDPVGAARRDQGPPARAICATNRRLLARRATSRLVTPATAGTPGSTTAADWSAAGSCP